MNKKNVLEIEEKTKQIDFFGSSETGLFLFDILKIVFSFISNSKEDSNLKFSINSVRK